MVLIQLVFWSADSFDKVDEIFEEIKENWSILVQGIVSLNVIFEMTNYRMLIRHVERLKDISEVVKLQQEM